MHQLLASTFNANAMIKAIDTCVHKSEENITRAAFAARSRLLLGSSNAKAMLKDMDAVAPGKRKRLRKATSSPGTGS